MIRKGYVKIDKVDFNSEEKSNIELVGKGLVEENKRKPISKAKKLNNNVIEIFVKDFSKIDLNSFRSRFLKNQFIYKKEIHLHYETKNESYLVLSCSCKNQKKTDQDYNFDKFRFLFTSPQIIYTSYFKKIVKNIEIKEKIGYFCNLFLNNMFSDFLKKSILSENSFTFNVSLNGNTVEIIFKIEPPIGKIDLDVVYDLQNYIIKTSQNIISFDFLFFLSKKQGQFNFECINLSSKKRKRRNNDHDSEPDNKKSKHVN
jgi:hypothetical protein